MVLPEIFHSLTELGAIGWDWTIATCGNGPLTRAVRSQLVDQQPIDNRLIELGKILVVDDGADVSTIEKLTGILKDAQTDTSLPVTIIANINDRSLLRAIENRCFEDGIHPRPMFVSEAKLIAEQTMLQHRLFQLAKWRNQARLNVVILGFGALGRSFLDEIMLDGIAAGLNKPSIEIITSNAEQAQAILRREMPEIGKSADVRVSSLVLEELGDPLRTPIAKAEEENPLTAIFALLDDPSQTLRAVAELCALQDLHGRGHAALFIGGAGAEMATRLIAPQRTSHNIAMQITKIDDLTSLPNVLATILIDRDTVAKRIHLAYEEQYLGKTRAGTSWDNLSETYRRANRRAASHLLQKLSALGVDMFGGRPFSGAVDPYTYDHLIMPLAKSSVEDESMRSLARLEHERWCADRRIDGWSFGEVRDDSRRLHPSLVSFDDPRLTADEIDKDVSQLRFLLGSVVKAQPGGATSWLSVGVVKCAGQPGIDANALCSRFALEPERSVILISPLLTLEELSAVASLMREFAASSRPMRLVVPEWFANNATLRDEAIEHDESLLALIADERSWIAPIGPQRFSASADWDEVTVTESQRQLLVEYVTARVDVLLAVQNQDLSV